MGAKQRIAALLALMEDGERQHRANIDARIARIDALGREAIAINNRLVAALDLNEVADDLPQLPH